jgi:hypothetical protein
VGSAMSGQRRTANYHALREPEGLGKVKSEPAAKRSKQAELPEAPLLFVRHEATLYTALATLPQRAGVPVSLLPLLVVKEFTDNASTVVVI